VRTRRVIAAPQVAGGRWKPLHHFLAASAFAPTTAALCANGRCVHQLNIYVSGVRPEKSWVSQCAHHS
jgi:hypothetical protein